MIGTERTPVRLLLVEDDDVHRETLGRHLTRTGYQVHPVESAERALSVFHSAAPDLILTDVRMPGTSGIQLLDRISGTGVPVIVMTAFSDMQGAIDAMKGGAYDYLTKPLDLDVLDQAIRLCVESRLAHREHSNEPHRARTDRLVGSDPRMVEIYKTIGKISHARTSVLIRGETGTGKELIARTIHDSVRPDQPFVAVNCAAVPESLLESELFGHVRGAFTGAVSDRRGRFELAGNGTVFLDEIGDTSIAFQAKLLRVIQEREFYPVGDERARHTQARIVAATHRNMEQLVKAGTFREDLYFRLRVVEISIPPLRERRADIPLLAEHIVARLSTEMNRSFILSDDMMGRLLTHDWPGNVRELENALTRAAVLARGGVLSPANLGLESQGPADRAPTFDEDQSLETMERVHVQRVLALTGSTKSRAAQILGVSRPRLDRLIARHGLVV